MTQVPLPPDPNTPKPSDANADMCAIAAIIIGPLSLVLACCCPLAGLPLGAAGIWLGNVGKQSQSKSTIAKVGLALSIAGVVFSVINAAYGAYLGATGQNPFVNFLKGARGGGTGPAGGGTP